MTDTNLPRTSFKQEIVLHEGGKNKVRIDPNDKERLTSEIEKKSRTAGSAKYITGWDFSKFKDSKNYKDNK